MEAEMLEQVALDEEMGESVWREMIEACTEVSIMLYIGPDSEMSEGELPEVGLLIVEQPLDKEYESDEEKYGRSKLGEYEQEEEKTLYEKESEKRASEEEPNENNKEVEEYGK